MNQRDLEQTGFLLDRIQHGQASDADYQQLLGLVAAHPEDEYTQFIHQYVEAHAAREPLTSASATDPEWKAMLQTILSIDQPKKDQALYHSAAPTNESFAAPVQQMPTQVGGRHLLKTAWFRAVAAAILIFTIGTVAWLWNTPTQKDTPTLVHTNPAPTGNDVAPGGNRALLTLADGRTIPLDSAANGQLATQGQSNIIKQADGEIRYVPGDGRMDVKGSTNQPMITGTNTMSTPKGGQYELRLPDGTHVWLNAASSITYPVAFAGGLREVSITGEVYFDVTKNPKQPFVVHTPSDVIRVMGTAFNVNSYSDEPFVKTSLVRGMVLINRQKLKPGEAYANGKLVTSNVQQDAAWINGIFNFDHVRVEEAMKQVARWYDVTVVYDGAVPQNQLFGEVDRQLTLNQLLAGLEGVAAHFRLEGKVLHVRPL